LLEGNKNVIGLNINTTARIEPITRPNEIYVTEDFKTRIESKPILNSFNVKFDELGEIPLAKDFGLYNLYRLRQSNEKEKIINRILKQDLSAILPEAKEVTKEQKTEIKYLRSILSVEILNKNLILNKIIHNECLNENYLFEIAKIYKEFGLYGNSLQVIHKIKNKTQNIDNLNLTLFKYKKELMKLESNCLTRLGKYEDASNLIYGAWQLGNKDSDTLSMLAAQYKRRALTNDNNIVDKNKINTALLNRALNLYIEAFRLNIEDYYPAVNIAYLYKIIGGENEGKGNKFAQYIIDTWGDKVNNWWLSSSILECEIIIGDFENLDKRFEESINKYSPTNFDKQSTLAQIELYKKLVGTTTTLEKIIKLLKG
jgi:tetratricopeptide (TPR) repeat protein